MCCYAGKLLQQPEMNNPTLVVVTDRNDLDGQLYQQFCAAKDLLKQTPEQAESREQLREMLAARQSGAIIFTTIQKFSLESQESDHPVLCARSERLSPAPRSSRARTCAQFSLRESLGAGKTRKNAQTAPLRCTPACFRPSAAHFPAFRGLRPPQENIERRTLNIERRRSKGAAPTFDVRRLMYQLPPRLRPLGCLIRPWLSVRCFHYLPAEACGGFPRIHTASPGRWHTQTKNVIMATDIIPQSYPNLDAWLDNLKAELQTRGTRLGLTGEALTKFVTRLDAVSVPVKKWVAAQKAVDDTSGQLATALEAHLPEIRREIKHLKSSAAYTDGDGEAMRIVGSGNGDFDSEG